MKGVAGSKGGMTVKKYISINKTTKIDSNMRFARTGRYKYFCEKSSRSVHLL